VNQGKRFFAPSIIALSIALISSSAWADDAEVVMLLGNGEVKESSQGNWRPVAIKQKLKAGDTVRTGATSQLALLLADQTQVRLNENSVFQISGVGNAESGTTLTLAKGRIWAQAKQLFKGFFRSTAGAINASPLKVDTPTATIGIRGTDWEVVVDDSGKTTVTVFSGQVQVGNDLGQLAIGPNEQAVTEHGKAPVKSLLSNAADRVQWVTAYRPTPRRWLGTVPASLTGAVEAIDRGDYAKALSSLDSQRRDPGAAVVLADLLIAMGRLGEARELLAPLADEGRGEARATALLGRLLTVAGETEVAQRLLLAGLQRHPAERELSLALADLLRLEGDGAAALRLFSEIAAAHPDSHEAWFGVGRIETEKENLGPARQALGEALRIETQAPGYLGEQATLETLAGNYETARQLFLAALDKAPDDYLALTGLGILQLKTGETEAALTSFLKAGVIEPRFARAQLYVGVTYYQLGNRKRALESVHKAAELDAKDPLPHVLLAMIHGDALELRDSIDAAREAQARMPYLKSLNQVLNNQKGSANVGASLAAQGMDEWARAYAMDSYNPHWAGSSLFLADRYPEGFNKNSELYKGFLLDPTVFGASNRYSSLVAVPGHYGSIGYLGSRGDFNQDALRTTANGLFDAKVPLAYSLVFEGADGHASPDTFKAHGHNFTAGVGARPTSDLGVFYFGTDTEVDGKFSDRSLLFDAPLKQSVARHDLGVGYRLAQNNQMLFKLGYGRQTSRLTGSLYDPSFPDVIAPGLDLFFDDIGRLERYRATTEQSDIQFRHDFDAAGSWRFAWGGEYAEQTSKLDYVRSFDNAVFPLNPFRVSLLPERSFTSSNLYLSTRKALADTLETQVDVAYQHFKTTTRLDNTQEFVGIPGTSGRIDERSEFDELNYRFGLRYAPLAGHQIRTVYQRWRRPVGTGSLTPVDTLGIPVDDRLVDLGGQLQRARLQYDGQWASDLFIQAFADRRRVNNIQSVAAPLFAVFGVTELDALRARKPVFGEPYSALEDTPLFGQGVVNSGGLAANWLLSRNVSLLARYIHSTSENTADAFSGKRVPLIPRHFGNLSAFWQPANRWLAGLSATYRSARYADEANASPLTAGWNFGLRTYWETEDKRWSLEAAVNNLHADKKSALDQKAEILFTTIYRF